MKLNKLLKSIIIENRRIQFLYDNNVKSNSGKKPSMDFETLKQIVSADPTTKLPEGVNIQDIFQEDMDKISAGSYSQWLVKNYVNIPLTQEEKNLERGSSEYKKMMKRKRDLYLEDLYKVTYDLKKYEKAKQYLPTNQRDINKFTPDELFLLLRDFEIPKKKKEKEQEKEIKKSRQGFEHKGSNIDLVTNNWTVVKIEGTGPEQKDAACYFGGFHEYDKGETRWCTSSPGLNYWENYLKKGPLYVIIPNNETELSPVTGLPKHRYQFHFQDAQFMDRHDHQINLVEFLNKNPDLKDYFKPEFAKNMVTKNTKTIKIKYPSDSESKYIAIYGLDELFNNMPKDITQLFFVNQSNEDFSFDIPDIIGEYKKLKSILIQKCLRSVSDKIGDCTNLSFIAFPDNPDLKELPESIVDLPNIKWVSLKGSDNLKLSEKFKNTFSEENVGFYTKD